MRFVWQAFLLIVAVFLFTWIFGLGGTAIKMMVLPPLALVPGGYLVGLFLINIVTTALSCWLTVFVTAKMGQLKPIDSPKKLAGAVTIVFAGVSLFPIIYAAMAGGEVPLFALFLIAVPLVVTYFTLNFFLARRAL